MLHKKSPIKAEKEESTSIIGNYDKRMKELDNINLKGYDSEVKKARRRTIVQNVNSEEAEIFIEYLKMVDEKGDTEEIDKIVNHKLLEIEKSSDIQSLREMANKEH